MYACVYIYKLNCGTRVAREERWRNLRQSICVHKHLSMCVYSRVLANIISWYDTVNGSRKHNQFMIRAPFTFGQNQPKWFGDGKWTHRAQQSKAKYKTKNIIHSGMCFRPLSVGTVCGSISTIQLKSEIFPFVSHSFHPPLFVPSRNGNRFQVYVENACVTEPLKYASILNWMPASFGLRTM